jgi:hypothetical protein
MLAARASIDAVLGPALLELDEAQAGLNRALVEMQNGAYVKALGSIGEAALFLGTVTGQADVSHDRQGLCARGRGPSLGHAPISISLKAVCNH